MTLLRYFFLSLLSLSLISNELKASDSDSVKLFVEKYFNNLSVKNGLSNNLINAFEQDKLGFMWIGSGDGLCRYGGNDFTVFRNDSNNKNTLCSNYINDLYFDEKNNKLWIATVQGLDVLNLEWMDFEHMDSLVLDGKSKLNAVCLASSQNDEIFIGVNDYAFMRYINDKVEYYDLSKDLDKKYGEVRDIEILDDNTVILAFGQNAIVFYELETKKTTIQILDNESSLNKLFRSKDGNILLSTNVGLYHYDRALGEFSKTIFTDLDGLDIVTTFVDSRTYLWVGTREQGLFISDTPVTNFLDNPSFSHYAPRYDGLSVYGKTVLSFFEDRDNGIWMGSWSSGISYTRFEEPDVYLITHNPYSESSISHRRVWGICYDQHQNLWLGTDGAGLNKYNIRTRENQVYLHDDKDRHSISGNSILSALEDEKGNLWFGTYKGGLNKYNPKTDRFTTYLHNPEDNFSLNRNDVRLLFEDSEKRLWVGSNGGGLQIYDPKTNQFISHPNFKNSDIRSMKEDNEGGIWVASYNSWFSYYHAKNEVFKKFSTNKIPELRGDKISSIELIGDELWLGCRFAGVIRYKIKTGEYKIFSEEDGLINNGVRSMIADDKGIWISTDRGISWMDIESEQFKNFDSSYGVQEGEFNVNSVAKLPNGYLCFGGTEGMNIINPEGLKKEVTGQKIHITEVSLFGEPISAKPNTKSTLYCSEYTLDYFENVVTFDFEVEKFPIAPIEVFYYKLEGNDTKWNVLKKANSVTYSNLESGEYTFKVARVNAQKEFGGISEFSITVLPPFWRTIWAYIAYIILGVGLLWLLIWYYTQQIKLRSSLVFEKKIRFQEHKLNQERIRFFTNFSHELRTPLTLIIGPVKHIISLTKDEELKSKLQLVKRNAVMLSNLINKMLEFRKTEVGNFKLQISEYDIVDVLERIMANYYDLCLVKGIKLKFNKPQDPINVWFDIEKLEIIMNNLISNAIKFSSKGGSITLEVETKKSSIKIWVRDTGQGMSKEAVKSIFHWFYNIKDSKNISGTGIGLALTKKLVEMHGGSISVKSDLGKGSAFYFSLLKGKDHLVHADMVDNRPLTIEIPELETASDLLVEVDVLSEKQENRSRVLVVDDNPDIVRYVKELIGKKFFVYTASDGQKGIEIAKEEIPDLILSDVMMPEKSGIDLCGELKSDVRTSHIPIVLLTAKHSSEDAALGYAKGADSYLTKPFDEEVLLSRIENLLQSRVTLKNYFVSLTSSDGREQANENSSSNVNEKRSKIENSFLQKVEEIIIEECIENGQELGVFDIAKKLGFSRASLYRKLKSVAGCSINEFARKVKLKKAEELISTGVMNVSEAAFYVGFNDVKYFRSIFKKEFGRLPSEVKKDAPERLL